jgi:hypothetical protein
MSVAFLNHVVVGADNEDFTDDTGAQVITNGLWRFDEFVYYFLDTWTKANRRIALSSTGHLTLSTSDASNFSITWAANGYLRDMMGFTGNLAAASSYTAPRKVRCAWHAVNATLREHDPQPVGMARQTRSMGGVTRTTWMGRRLDVTVFEVQFASSASRLVSPSGAVATTYANAAATEDGLTEYRHARDFWSDCTSVANQGWSDGRPVTFFESAADSAFTMTSASAPAWNGLATFSNWVFDAEACSAFPRQKDRPPLTTLYSMRIPAAEYVAP